MKTLTGILLIVFWVLVVLLLVIKRKCPHRVRVYEHGKGYRWKRCGLRGCGKHGF